MTLTQLFTNIANAIRAKTGSSKTIVAEDFPTEIAEITTGNLTNEEYSEANDDLDDILENTTVPSGTLNITENGEYDVTNYIEANVNVESEYNAKINNTPNTYSGNSLIEFVSELPELDLSRINGSQFLFEQCKNISEIPNIKNTSHLTNMNGMFKNCEKVETIPYIDTLNVTSMREMFSNCSSLKSIPQLNTSKVTTMYNLFYNCNNLITVPLLDTSNISASSGFAGLFAYCYNLSNESLNNILQMCINATSYTGTKTLKYIGLSSTQATTCQSLSNYQAFLDAGWTTGY